MNRKKDINLFIVDKNKNIICDKFISRIVCDELLKLINQYETENKE